MTADDRARGVGASEIAAVLGLHPTKSPVDIWLMKTGRATWSGRLTPGVEPGLLDDAAPADPDDDSLPEMRWGHAMEPVIADWYASENGAAFDPLYDGEHAARDPEFPSVWASPDRVTLEPRDVEIKAVGWQMAYQWGEVGTEKIPLPYWLQVQMQQRCTKAVADAHVVAAIAGRPPDVWVVPHDVELARTLAERAQAWFDYYVTADREPPPHKREDAIKLVRAMFPKSVRRDADVTPRLREAVRAYREAKGVLVDAKALVSFHEAAIKRAMGDADSARDPEFSITWRTNAKGSRVFRPTFKGEE